MNKAIIKIEPFQRNQTIYIYKDNMKVDAIETDLDNLTISLSNAIEEYQINKIKFAGPKNFTHKYGEKLEECISTKFTSKNIEITYM